MSDHWLNEVGAYYNSLDEQEEQEQVCSCSECNEKFLEEELRNGVCQECIDFQLKELLDDE
jgi:formylmethanofuran dehydrogenase subunit E